jgi:DNA-binding transcriptional MerR regulator/effector-binding domain-containing protein
MSDMELTEELSIGAFSRVSGLTVKALRHYDEIGLLEPARVDEGTGYRYYGLEQARAAEAIRRLRSLEIPLDEIRELLGADEPVVRERLAVHRARLEGRAVETKRILDELDRIIDGREKLVPDAKQLAPELEVKEVPARRVAFIGERVHMEEMSKVVPRNIDRVAEAIRMRHAGPPFCKCPAPDEEGYFETEIGWPIPGDVEVEAPFEVTEYPAATALVLKHVGPYEELGRSYRFMAEQLEERSLTAAGAPVEWYESDPEKVPDPKDYVTIIEWPLVTE